MQTSYYFRLSIEIALILFDSNFIVKKPFRYPFMITLQTTYQNHSSSFHYKLLGLIFISARFKEYL